MFTICSSSSLESAKSTESTAGADGESGQTFITSSSFHCLLVMMSFIFILRKLTIYFDVPCFVAFEES